MTRLSASGVRAAVRAHHLSEEDRSTYRQWARRSTIAYFIINALLAVDLALRDRPDSQVTSRVEAIDAATTLTPQVTGGVRKPNYF